MNFKKRLGYYLVGLLVGIMFLIFIFQGKNTEFCYLPNCRVLKDLRSKGMVISPEVQKMLDEKLVTMDEIKACMNDGDVDFSKSNTIFEGGKLYTIECENAKNETVVIEMVNFDTKVLLKDIKKG